MRIEIFTQYYKMVLNIKGANFFYHVPVRELGKVKCQLAFVKSLSIVEVKQN